jgi:hypothetical protein
MKAIGHTPPTNESAESLGRFTQVIAALSKQKLKVSCFTDAQ